MSAKPKALSGLTRRLIQDGLIDQDTAEKHETAAAAKKMPIISHLVREAKVSPEAIAIIQGFRKCHERRIGVSTSELSGERGFVSVFLSLSGFGVCFLVSPAPAPFILQARGIIC